MQQQSRWYRLDNAAKIYPATGSRHWNSTFRIWAVLEEDIRPDALATAVDELKLRFPTFFVQLRLGLFWYYFEPTVSPDIVGPEKHYPCSPIEIGHSKKPIFRVLYYKNRISLELFHAGADGGGAMVFFKSLLANYLSHIGVDVSDARWEIKDPRGRALASETEDSFSRYYEKPQNAKRSEPAAYKYRPPRPQNDNYIRLIIGSMDAEELHQAAKRHGASVTQYLAAVYALSFIRNMPVSKRKKPVRISVPVNLRKLFPSETLRNFSLYVNVSVTPDPNAGVDDVLREIIPQLKAGFEKSALLNAFSMNVAAERNPVMRIMPLAIKKLALKFAYRLWGENRYTSAISNLGVISLPECMSRHVREIGLSLGCSPAIAINLAVMSYNGRLSTIFSSRSPQTEIQSQFFGIIASENIAIEVESNE